MSGCYFRRPLLWPVPEPSKRKPDVFLERELELFLVRSWRNIARKFTRLFMMQSSEFLMGKGTAAANQRRLNPAPLTPFCVLGTNFPQPHSLSYLRSPPRRSRGQMGLPPIVVDLDATASSRLRPRRSRPTGPTSSASRCRSPRPSNMPRADSSSRIQKRYRATLMTATRLRP